MTVESYHALDNSFLSQTQPIAANMLLINQPGAKPKQIRFDFRALSRCLTTVIRKPLKKRQSPQRRILGWARTSYPHH